MVPITDGEAIRINEGSDRSTGSRGRGTGILVCVGKKGNIPSFDEGSPNGAPGKRMPGGLRVVFRVLRGGLTQALKFRVIQG